MHCSLLDADMDSTESWIERCLSESEGKGRYPPEHSPLGSLSNEEEHDEKDNSRASKPHSTPATLQWLEDNYEIAEGVCIPRSALYMHYLDFCEKNDTQPVNAASFGKIIRQQFPQLTTRRLGTRGQSKYHYYGIAVKESSAYYDVMYSKKGAAGLGDTAKKEAPKQAVAYSPRSKLGTLLPDFPSVKELTLPTGIPAEKVSTFIMMYRTHCQRILDTVIRANFDEVQSFLLHFWQGMPPHMLPVLGSPAVANIVGVCDSILYKAISGVLMPTVLQALPDSLTQVIRKFAKQLDEWLRVALDDLPENLCVVKFELARRFSQILRRQTSLNHLCQASRTVIHSADIASQMLEDWRSVDLGSISKQTLYTVDEWREEHRALTETLYQEFEQLLEEQSPMESYIEWLDSMVERCVVKPATRRPGTLKQVARQFLLMWSCFGTRIIRDMTLHSAPSFGSFHLIHLMFDDYVLYLLESLHCQERAAELLRAMRGEGPVGAADEAALPNPRLPSPTTTTTSTAAFHPQESTIGMETQSVVSSLSAHSPGPSGVTSPTGSNRSFPRSPVAPFQSVAAVAAPGSVPQGDLSPQATLPYARAFPSPHSPLGHTPHRSAPAFPQHEQHGSYTGSYNYTSYAPAVPAQHPHAHHPHAHPHPAAPHHGSAGPAVTSYHAVSHEQPVLAQLHYPTAAYHHHHHRRSAPQYPFSRQSGRLEPCLLGPSAGTGSVAPRWGDGTGGGGGSGGHALVGGACYGSPASSVSPSSVSPSSSSAAAHHHHHHHNHHNHGHHHHHAHVQRYSASGAVAPLPAPPTSDMFAPLGMARRASDYDPGQHFPGFAYISGEAAAAASAWSK
ncbi:transcription factor RFX4 [Lampetra fluviatilis]